MKRAWIFAIFALGMLSPYLVTGYYEDDSITSLLPTALTLKGMHLLPYIAWDIQSWARDAARFFPLTLIVSDSFWYFVHDLETYRLLQITAILLNLLLFFQLIRESGGSHKLGFLAVMIVLGLFQLRDFHDPVSSYTFILQNTLSLGLGSAILLGRFREKGRPGLLWTSAGLYVCALLYYEVALAFTPILLYLALGKARARYPQKALVFAVFVSITFAYLGLVGILRVLQPAVYTGIKLKLSLKALATFAFQLSAALPLTYSIFGRSGFYSTATLSSAEFWSLSAIAIWFAGTALFFWIYRMPEEKRDSQDYRELRFLGFALALVPAILIALSARYQNEVTRPGIGYLPVYFSYFGVALLMALALERVRKRFAVSIVLAGLLAFTFSANWIAADRLNRYWKYPRVLMEKALHGGLLAEVPDGSRLIANFSYNWMTSTFVLHNSGRKFEITAITDSHAPKSATSTKDWLIGLKTLEDSHGEVSLTAIQGSAKRTMRF